MEGIIGSDDGLLGARGPWMRREYLVVTRSSSPKPVGRRGSSLSTTSDNRRGCDALAVHDLRSARSFESVTRFNESPAPHAGQRPCHCRLSFPHSSQTKMCRDLAMASVQRSESIQNACGVSMRQPAAHRLGPHACDARSLLSSRSRCAHHAAPACVTPPSIRV